MGCCFHEKGATICQPPEGKVGVLIMIFEAGLWPPTTDFFDEIMHLYGFSVNDLTPNVINKIVGFEFGCRALGVLP